MKHINFLILYNIPLQDQITFDALDRKQFISPKICLMWKLDSLEAYNAKIMMSVGINKNWKQNLSLLILYKLTYTFIYISFVHEV